jgi:hypothetical protein
MVIARCREYKWILSMREIGEKHELFWLMAWLKKQTTCLASTKP